MSVSKWAYEAEKCDGQPCVGDCDLCDKAENIECHDNRTIAECIKNSLDGVESLGGKRPMVWEYFLMNFCAVMLGVISTMLEHTMPKATIGAELFGGGKGAENDPFPFLRVLTQTDFIRGCVLHWQMTDFFNWYLQQNNHDFADDEELEMWYDFAPMIKAWNEFAEMKNKDAQKMNTFDDFMNIFSARNDE